MAWQLPIFYSEAVDEDGDLFKSIVTAFRHRMTRRPSGLQSASVEPSGIDLARIVIVSLTWIYVFFPFFLSLTGNWEALNISTQYIVPHSSNYYLPTKNFSPMFARCE